MMVPKSQKTVSNITVLVDLRRDLELILSRVNAALAEYGEVRPRLQLPVTQTLPAELDFREKSEAELHDALRWTYDQAIRMMDSIPEDQALPERDTKALHRDISILTARTRLLQVQTTEGSREWETAVGIIRTLTRIVAETQAGFVYGLAISHNTDWGNLYTSLMKEKQQS